jgi:dTDP-4-amino-4,6-dideoxygalactose transaminase
MAIGAAWRSARLGLRAREDSRPRVRALVRVLFQADDAVLLGSGTQALALALRAAATARGDGGEGPQVVALPAYACYDVATAAVAANARIALYDVNPATLGPDLASLTATLAEGARIVVVAPLYGMPVDWDAIERCVERFGALAIEDAAQGHGAFWRGRPLGSLGRLSVLSFSRGKGWTAGRGGALLARGDVPVVDGTPPECGSMGEVAVALMALAQSALGRPGTYGLPAAIPWLHLGETRYREPEKPRAISRTAAALLERTLPLATREAEARRANATALLGRLRSHSDACTILPPPGATPGYLRLPLRLPRGLDALADRSLARRVGVAAGYPSTLAALPQVRQRLVRMGRWPGAEDLVRELVTLPTHSLVSETNREALVRLLEREV